MERDSHRQVLADQRLTMWRSRCQTAATGVSLLQTGLSSPGHDDPKPPHRSIEYRWPQPPTSGHRVSERAVPERSFRSTLTPSCGLVPNRWRSYLDGKRAGLTRCRLDLWFLDCCHWLHFWPSLLLWTPGAAGNSVNKTRIQCLFASFISTWA